jgi:Cd2+/Zn2+-exporting ATPase
MSDEHHDEWKKLAVFAVISGLFGLLALLVSHSYPPENSLHWISTLLLALSCLAGGWDALIDGWASLREKRVDVHTLMILVAGGSWIIGHPEEGALLLFLFSTAGAIEHYAMFRTRGAIDALLDRAPKQARVIESDGKENIISVSALKPGHQIIVLPGELVPADGQVVSGESSVDESTLTGEAKPVDKKTGSLVSSGTLNSWGRLVVLVTKAEKDSSLQRIVTLIREAQESKAPAQRAIDRWGDIYAIFTLSASLLFFLYQYYVLHNPIMGGETSALYRAMTLMVVLSPCALVLSVPSAILAAIAAGARQGILFRGGAAVERLSGVNTICFDKTGTLTSGEPVVASLEVYPPENRKKTLSALLSVESNSTHPFAGGILKACRAEGAQLLSVNGLANFPGKGISGEIDAVTWKIGGRDFVGCAALPSTNTDSGAIISEVWASDGTSIARVTLVDEVREQSASTLSALHQLGIHTIMLTGDREEAAAVAAKKVGVEKFAAALSPEAKMQTVRKISSEGHIVAMVGDGVNDAPSLVAADIAIAMGSRGSDAALESSDVVLMDDKIEKLLNAIELSKAARTAIRINIIISVGAALTMATIVIFQGATLSLGVMVHEGSTVIVCLNGLRLLAHRPKA